jgi:hypothetical protein
MSRSLVPAVALALLAGCSGSATQGTVSGEVRIDGQPLQDGLIRFSPADGKSGGTDAPITAGRYTIAAPPGEAKVEIRGKKVVGKYRPMPESPEVEKVEELVDAKFNDRTELRYTVQGGSQTKDFEVTRRR